MIFILTGAGISQESGIDTFRDKGGLWRKVRVEDVATPAGFRRDAAKVHRFYNQRRKELTSSRRVPNAAHLALAELALTLDRGEVFLVTQNVDDLHERAGSPEVCHLHGSLLSALCLNCGRRSDWKGDMDRSSSCPKCAQKGGLRPDVVWFGERPFHFDLVYEMLSRCSLFVSIGTSGAVYPAAGLVGGAKASGAKTLEINVVPTGREKLFDEGLYGPATEMVPLWTEKLIKNK
ncbi:MAG: NAD-dependent deacylase [Deltaproteobacteria bacterium]|nr:NAD-dependent deacylase [Deltaproteobacteria bacterium]